MCVITERSIKEEVEGFTVAFGNGKPKIEYLRSSILTQMERHQMLSIHAEGIVAKPF